MPRPKNSGGRFYAKNRNRRNGGAAEKFETVVTAGRPSNFHKVMQFQKVMGVTSQHASQGNAHYLSELHGKIKTSRISRPRTDRPARAISKGNGRYLATRTARVTPIEMDVIEFETASLRLAPKFLKIRPLRLTMLPTLRLYLAMRKILMNRNRRNGAAEKFSQGNAISKGNGRYLATRIAR